MLTTGENNVMIITNANLRKTIIDRVPTDDEDVSVERAFVLVEGAGTVEVNGEYHFSGLGNTAAKFSRTEIIENKEVTYVIFMAVDGYWRIARDGNTPYYIRTETTTSGRLPSGGIANRLAGSAPPPRITVFHRYYEFSEDEADSKFEKNPDGYTAFYRNESVKDCTILYGEIEFKAHRGFLVSVSLYFQRLFSGEWKETSSCSVQPLSDCSSTDFRAFLKYIYTTSRVLLKKRAWAIWELCDYFEVLPSFKNEVLRHLLKSLTVETAEKYIPLVNQNSLILGQSPLSKFATGIQETFVKFVVDNSKSLATAGFPFRELEGPILNAIFQKAH
jgi:hypothetical protein